MLSCEIALGTPAFGENHLQVRLISLIAIEQLKIVCERDLRDFKWFEKSTASFGGHLVFFVLR